MPIKPKIPTIPPGQPCDYCGVPATVITLARVAIDDDVIRQDSYTCLADSRRPVAAWEAVATRDVAVSIADYSGPYVRVKRLS